MATSLGILRQKVRAYWEPYLATRMARREAWTGLLFIAPWLVGFLLLKFTVFGQLAAGGILNGTQPADKPSARLLKRLGLRGIARGEFVISRERWLALRQASTQRRIGLWLGSCITGGIAPVMYLRSDVDWNGIKVCQTQRMAKM